MLYQRHAGKIQGVTTDLKPASLIVQDWRSDGWPSEPSRASFALEPAHQGRACALTFRHTGVPQEKLAQIDQGWPKLVDETWTKDCVLHVPGFQPPPGRAGQKEVGKAIFSAFSNVHVDVLDTIVEGDRVVERHRAEAVHTGEFMGIPASDKKVHWTENHIYRMQDGLTAETWSEVSFHDLLAQISGAKSSTA